MIPTQWAVQMITIGGEPLAYRAGAASTRATALNEIVAAARRLAIEASAGFLPWYLLSIDGDVVAIVGTGARSDDIRSDHAAVLAIFDGLERRGAEIENGRLGSRPGV